MMTLIDLLPLFSVLLSKMRLTCKWNESEVSSCKRNFKYNIIFGTSPLQIFIVVDEQTTVLFLSFYLFFRPAHY